MKNTNWNDPNFQGFGRQPRPKKERHAVGTPVGRTLLNIAVTLVFAAVYFYVVLPPISLKSEDFYIFVLLVCAVYGGCAILTSGFQGTGAKGYFTFLKKQCTVPLIAAAALIVWNVVLCALGLISWSGWIMLSVMIAAYIIIMRRLFALAGELDNAGCTITPVPVRVKDWQLVLSLAVLLAAGMACGYAFGGSYPMEWTPLDNSAQAEVQSTKAKLLELGFPEAVLNDLSSEDIAMCEGATQILSRTEDKPVNDGREVTTQTGENSYRIDTVYDAKELRLTGVAVRVGEYRWIIFHHFLWTQPMNYCGTEAVQLWPNGQSDWWPDGDATGRVLCGRDGQTLAAAYHSLDTQDTFTTDFFGNSQSSINLTGAFSMPRGSENQRGYVCFPIQTAQEDTYVNSWVNYTHQNTWAQYPARTAREGMWSSSAFKTIQFALQFDATEGRMMY